MDCDIRRQHIFNWWTIIIEKNAFQLIFVFLLNNDARYVYMLFFFLKPTIVSDLVKLIFVREFNFGDWRFTLREQFFVIRKCLFFLAGN